MKRPESKCMVVFLTCLLLFRFTGSAMAWPDWCKGVCCDWDGWSCITTSCSPCYNCVSCQCYSACIPGATCCNGSCCNSGNCCNSTTCCPNSDDICCTDSGSYCCESGKTCCEGNCCDLGIECCDGECAVSTDNCWGINLTIIYDGSCVCFDPPVTCMSNDSDLQDLGYGKMATYVRECVKVDQGTCGRTQCNVLTGENQLIAKLWSCNDETEMMGSLLCWEANALVCIAQCSVAASACALNPGSPECSQGLEDCAQCLASEGIDCGCLEVWCSYNEPPDEIWGETLAAYGPKCNRP